MSLPAAPTHHEHIAWLRGELVRLEEREVAARAQMRRDKGGPDEHRSRETWALVLAETEHRDRDLSYWTRIVAENPALKGQRIRSGLKEPKPAPADVARHYSEPREPGGDDSDDGIAF